MALEKFPAPPFVFACHMEQRRIEDLRLHQLLEHVERLTAEDFADDLKIIMGHTPLQVAAGAILGLGIGLLA